MIQLAGVMHQRRGVRTVLVLCPKSVIGVWVREIEKFALYPCRAIALGGESVAKRAAKVIASTLDDFAGVTFLVCNYDVVWRPALLKALTDATPDVVVCDEAHRIKNAGSESAKATRKISAGAVKIALTGTPVDTLQDWYGIYRWLDPSVFGTSFTAFQARYFETRQLPGTQVQIIVRPKDEMREELLTKAHSLMHVARKDEWLADLPKALPSIDLYCELEPAARKQYDAMRDEAIAYLSDDEAIVGQNALTRLLRLTQITGGFVRHGDDVVQVSSAKLGLLKDRMVDLLETERKIVVVANRTPEIDAIMMMLRTGPFYLNGTEAGQKGGRVGTCGLIDGRTPQAEREAAIDEFQNGDTMRVIVLQEQAAGEGITLHAAATMVRYSGGASSIKHRQMKGRIDRIGQTRPCSYINLLCENTVDADLLRMVESKAAESTLTAADVRRMLG